MNVISRWLIVNKLSLNVSKTKFMLFLQSHSGRDPSFENLSFDFGTIQRVETFDYLGLVLDQGLTFKMHVRKVVKKIQPYVGILGRLKHYLPINCLKLIYYSYIHSNIHYLLPAYGSCSKSHLEQLEILHKKSLKHVFKLRYDFPTSELYKKGIIDIYTMTKHEMVLLLYKIKNNLIKSNFRIKNREETTGRITRQSSQFDVVFTHLTFIKDSFFSRGYEVFNSLPSNIKNCRSISEFKNRTLTYFKTHVNC